MTKDRKAGSLLRWVLYLASGLLLTYFLWSVASQLLDQGDYIGTVLVLGVAFVAVAVTYLHRRRPLDKFQFFHPFKVPETTTTRHLWLIAGFDTMAVLAMFSVFVIPMIITYGTGAVFIAAIVGAMMLATLPNGYRYMRRLYDPLQIGEASDRHLTLLRYRGYSESRFREMLLAGVPTSALVFVVLLFVLVFVL